MVVRLSRRIRDEEEGRAIAPGAVNGQRNHTSPNNSGASGVAVWKTLSLFLIVLLFLIITETIEVKTPSHRNKEDQVSLGGIVQVKSTTPSEDMDDNSMNMKQASPPTNVLHPEPTYAPTAATKQEPTNPPVEAPKPETNDADPPFEGQVVQANTNAPPKETEGVLKPQTTDPFYAGRFGIRQKDGATHLPATRPANERPNKTRNA
jgi:hypothetical protein